MFEQYSYKIKCKALIAIVVILSITAYKRSFSTLIALYKENKELSFKMNQINNSTNDAKKIQQEINILNKLIGKEAIDKEKIQQKIVAFILSNPTNVSLNNIVSVHSFPENDFTINTYQVDLVGNFNKLIRIQYDFEKNFEYAKIISSKWYKQTKENKINILHLTLIFQNYENH